MNAPLFLRALRWLTVLLTVSAVAVSGAIPPDLARPEHVIDAENLDPAWQEVLTGLQPEEALQASFSERRENDFRRGHRTFRGTLRVWDDRGVSLRYEGGIDVTLVAAPGAVWRRPANGEWTAYTVDPDSGMGDWGASLWKLDLDALSSAFTIYGRRDAETGSWELLFTPRAGRGSSRLYLQGDASAVTQLEVETNPTRRSIYFLRDVDRDPTTDDWAAFFPTQP